MNIDLIQKQALEVSYCIAASCQKISKIAVCNLGKAYEWLQAKLPVVMEKAAVVAAKVAVAAKPYMAILGTWAVTNKDFLITGGLGIVVGAAVASYIFYKIQPQNA
jgi:hypothetical protein